MATWRVNNSTLLGGEVCSPWQANHAYALGARVVCTIAYGTVARRGYVYECTTAGNSHATTEPVWPTTGTIADGPDTLVWTARIPNDGAWNNASCYLYYILNHAIGIASGDFVYVDDGHSESMSPGATTAYILKGGLTRGDPIKILCVDKADDSLSVGAVVIHTGTSTIYDLGISNYGYSYGVQYKTGAHIDCTGAWTVETSPGNKIFSIASARGLGFQGIDDLDELTLLGDIEFEAADAYITAGSPLFWKRGSVIAPFGVTDLVKGQISVALFMVRISNVDLTAVGNNNLVNPLTYAPSQVLFTRCKLPVAFTATANPGGYTQSWVKLHHCSDGNRAYDFYEEYYCGVCQDETTIVRTGGASDGTTPISIKMVSSAGTIDQYVALESPPITCWTDSTSEVTFTIELVHDSLTALQDDEIWMELEYPANNTDGLGALATSKCVNLGTPADIAASTETWTTTGLTNPNTRKLSVTVTPGKKGPITARVYVGKASTTVYVDPIITES